MNINSVILKEEAKKVNMIYVNQINRDEKTIKSHQDDIGRYRDDIIKTQKEIDSFYERKRNYIKN